MVEFLLLCILIMQVISYHSTAHNSSWYKRQFNTVMYRIPKFLGRKICILTKMVVVKFKDLKKNKHRRLKC